MEVVPTAFGVNVGVACVFGLRPLVVGFQCTKAALLLGKAHDCVLWYVYHLFLSFYGSKKPRPISDCVALLPIFFFVLDKRLFDCPHPLEYPAVVLIP